MLPLKEGRQRRKKRRKRDVLEIDEESDHPVHEPYVKQGHRKQA